MDAQRPPTTTRAEVIRSPALYLGEIEVVEPPKTNKSLLSGTRIKAWLFPLSYLFMRHAPRPLTLFPLWVVTGLAWLFYWAPGNLLRRSCACVSRLSQRAGHAVRPWTIYRRFLRNVLAVAGQYLRLYRDGVETVLDGVALEPGARDMILGLLQEHGGVVLAVPHNLGSVLSSLRTNHEFPTLVVSRNSATVARTRLTLDFFERMKVQVLMVRGGSAFELSRTLIAELRKCKAIAATVENIDRSPHSVKARIFGQEVGFAPWAAKIAVKMKVPVVPIYCGCREDRIYVEIAEPLVAATAEEAVQHYVSFFEAKILQDPASWIFLADKKWYGVLRRATGGCD